MITLTPCPRCGKPLTPRLAAAIADPTQPEDCPRSPGYAARSLSRALRALGSSADVAAEAFAALPALEATRHENLPRPRTTSTK